MKIEHMAFNVSDPNAMGRWYVEHLGFTVKRRLVEPPYTHFLADDSGTVMIEIYRQDAPIPDYQGTHVMALHLAIVSHDVESDVQRLVAAGGTLDGDIQTFPTGDCYAMVRDPWGLTLQLVSRSEPMIP
jgi:catechol 2,3-dioxygenase-like lactoylglutathione lyase family enzyme